MRPQSARNAHPKHAQYLPCKMAHVDPATHYNIVREFLEKFISLMHYSVANCRNGASRVRPIMAIRTYLLPNYFLGQAQSDEISSTALGVLICHINN